jgi:hypothetical protein
MVMYVNEIDHKFIINYLLNKYKYKMHNKIDIFILILYYLRVLENVAELNFVSL